MMQTTETGAGTTTGGGAAAVPAATNSEETFGPFVYIDGRLAEVRFDDGYCTIDSSGRADYHYYVRDYMGSVCVVTDDEGNIEQQNAYYAWGGIYSAMSVNPALQDRKYSGKPFDRRHGLDLYDYGARRYDPALARWTSPDPLCESYYNISPYAFCHDNPVNRIDVDGKFDSKIGALLYKIFHGGTVLYAKDKKEWFVGKQVAYKGTGAGIAYERVFNWKGSNSSGNINDDTKNWWANTKTALQMFGEWDQGVGPAYRIFINDRVANSFRNATKVNKARKYFYNKYSGVSNLANASVTNYEGNFGLLGLIKAGADPIEQFVGSYRVDINVLDCNTLEFTITNVTSMRSFLYGIGPDWERKIFKLNGNTRQIYIFTEPINK